jgi:hypothetical protein
MIITKKHLSRRTFLRGSGVTVALPLLDAMVPAATPKPQQPAQTPRRLTVYLSPEAYHALEAASAPEHRGTHIKMVNWCNAHESQAEAEPSALLRLPSNGAEFLEARKASKALLGYTSIYDRL